jgi:hypothetical protein
MPRAKATHPFHLVQVGIPSYNPLEEKPVLRITAIDEKDGRLLEGDFTPEEFRVWAASLNKWADLYDDMVSRKK